MGRKTEEQRTDEILRRTRDFVGRGLEGGGGAEGEEAG